LPAGDSAEQGAPAEAVLLPAAAHAAAVPQVAPDAGEAPQPVAAEVWGAAALQPAAGASVAAEVQQLAVAARAAAVVPQPAAEVRDAAGAAQPRVAPGVPVALPSGLPSASVFRRDQVLPWPAPRPAARFARAMTCWRNAVP
jgi:hypothetical protein